MNLSAIQVVRPIPEERNPVVVVASRLGRLASIYLLIAATGAALALILPLLRYRSFLLSAAGGAAGLFAAYAVVTGIVAYIQSVEARRAARLHEELTKRIEDIDTGLWESDGGRIDVKRTVMRQTRWLYILHWVEGVGALVFSPILVFLTELPFEFRCGLGVGLVIGGTLLAIARFVFHIDLPTGSTPTGG
jgi:hypothetical protein